MNTATEQNFERFRCLLKSGVSDSSVCLAQTWFLFLNV